MNTVLSQPNRGGRPLGATNHATRSMKAVAQQFFESEAYRDSMKQRILAGSAPQLEVYLLQLLYGKPKETVDVRVGRIEDDLATLSTKELADQAQALLDKIRDATALEETLTTIDVSPCERPGEVGGEEC